jgi:SAM-dependent methyltransferase
VHPFPSPGEIDRLYAPDYYGGAGEEKFSPLAERVMVRAALGRARRLAGLAGEGVGAAKENGPPRVLDVGCGRGLFLKAMQRLGWECHGIEIPSFPLPPSEPRIAFHHGTVETVELPPASFDAVSIWHVLEHTGEPVRTLSRAAELLAPGGVLAVAVPNFGSAQRRLFGRHWLHLDLPRHLWHVDRRGLDPILSRLGLVVEEVSTRSPEQDLFGFVQSSLNALFPSSPNRLFFALRRQSPRGVAPAPAVTAASFLLAPLLAVPALAEHLLSALSGTGATLVVYARKRG